jgi:hypothetical protein
MGQFPNEANVKEFMGNTLWEPQVREQRLNMQR